MGINALIYCVYETNHYMLNSDIFLAWRCLHFHDTQLPKKGKPRKNDVFTGFNLK